MYPEAKFCSAEHGYFDNNKKEGCPQCAQDKQRIQDRKELSLHNQIRKLHKQIEAKDKKIERFEKIIADRPARRNLGFKEYGTPPEGS